MSAAGAHEAGGPYDGRRQALQRASIALQNKWTLLVVAELLERPQRFSELRTSLDQFNPKTLTDALRQLERHGIVERVSNPSHYALTERGHALRPIVEAVVTWAEAKLAADADLDEFEARTTDPEPLRSLRRR